MAKANESIVKKWRGNRPTYDALTTKDYWTHYYVKESSGLWSEYFGTNPIKQATGQLFPVITVAETLPSNVKKGERYLIGRDATSTTEAEYYIVEISDPLSSSTIINLGDMSVRVKDRKLQSYQIVDGKLITYDGDIFCGTF